MAVDYNLGSLPWMNFDPAQRLLQGLAAGRANQAQHFQQGQEQDQSDLQQQAAQERTAAAARKLAADQQFQSLVSQLDPNSPDYTTKYRTAMLNWAAQTGQFTPGVASTTKALTPAPPKPQPGFSLRPGETRFDASGNPVANLPAATPAGQQPHVLNLPLSIGGGDQGEAQDTENPTRSVAPDKTVPVVVGGNRWQVLNQKPPPLTKAAPPPLPSSLKEVPVLDSNGKVDPNFVAVPNSKGGLSVQRVAKQKTEGNVADEATLLKYVEKAGGDKAKARKQLLEDGYTIPQ